MKHVKHTLKGGHVKKTIRESYNEFKPLGLRLAHPGPHLCPLPNYQILKCEHSSKPIQMEKFENFWIFLQDMKQTRYSKVLGVSSENPGRWAESHKQVIGLLIITKVFRSN